METKIVRNFGGRNISISTGKLAKQAGGAVVVEYGQTVVLVTACSDNNARQSLDFLPLTVEYSEKSYAAGKIPGGFFKREMGRPSEAATLISRLIDRPIRPLFPEGYNYEIQIIATVLSYDKVNEPAIAALIGASAAIGISDIPFKTPLAGVRVGRENGQFICNPSSEILEKSDLDLLVAASKDGILMVEAGGAEVSETDMVDALLFAQEVIGPILEMQDELIAKCGKEKRGFEAVKVDDELRKNISKGASGPIDKALRVKDKNLRYKTFDEIKENLKKKLIEESGNEDEIELINSQFSTIFSELKNNTAREITLSEGKRIDGRAYDEIRDIWGEVSYLPRTHGSAVFTRGETQALVTCTLGTDDDEQIIDTMEFNKKEKFLLHYNFPPYCVGEVKRLASPGRRELGHGNLARRAITSVVPDIKDFNYTIRLVSEVLESNGSSSMATVCGGTLALFDAGVPIKGPVAGIAMGLVKEGDKVAILSDILGDEDHFGDMDFKVCGTEKGITALQMDIKIDGLERELLTRALEQARIGRLHILSKMKGILSAPRESLSEYAPVITSIKIHQDKIKILIGPGGKNIKNIISESGAKIEVDEAGKVNVISNDPDAAKMAIKMIKDLVADPEIGTVYEGTVKKIMNFGAFIEIMPKVEALLHISEIDHQRVNKVEDFFREGDKVKVQLTGIDRDGKLKLSRKVLLNKK